MCVIGRYNLKSGRNVGTGDSHGEAERERDFLGTGWYWCLPLTVHAVGKSSVLYVRHTYLRSCTVLVQ